MMSDRKRKASSSEEPVCALCGQADVDPDICGHTLFETGIRVHEFCLTSANITAKARPGIEVLPLAAIARKVRQANKKQCCVCGERGAAVTCAERGCARSFHLPCAKDGECITQYFGDYRSFCWEHRPQQATQEAPAEGTICLICLEPVGDSLSYHTMVCPACKHVWFHRGCIQVGAHPAPCRHARCSAAPGTAHAHPACASPAATGLECWHCVLRVPRLPRLHSLL
ncbi:PHD finger protein 7-like isoform X1 [Gallus gallus]|uniref:PHD finger protein 7-like isoform X1 n=2 Tax=Gallus gallus TaxID=9031 RepID=UPI001AEB0CFB|nr:PHD finger protein 7-like isoform X1 [Gallus gallus]